MPTDCDAWDVRKMALHVLGSGDAQASFPQFLHQLRRGRPLNKEIDSHHWVDGLNELQIRERAHLSDARDRRAAHRRRAEGGEGPVGNAAADALPPDPVRAADRLGSAQVPPRRRLHARRLGAPHRHLRGDGPRDAPHRRSRRPPGRRHRRGVGARSTASRSIWCSRDPRAGSSHRASAASGSRSTRSTSSASLPVAGPGTGVLAHPLPL